MTTAIRTISQITIPSKTLAIVPTTFNRTPKPDCYYNFTGTPSMSEQNLFVVPLLKIFGTKLPVHLLCTIINAIPNDVILPKNWHISEMKPLNYTDNSAPPLINEVMYDINPNTVSTYWMQLHHCPPTPCEVSTKACPYEQALL